MAAPMPNVFIGSETGLLKGINPLKSTWNNLNTIQTPDKANEITCLSWADKKRSSFYVGRRGQAIAKFSVDNQLLSDFTKYDCGTGSLKSVGVCDDLLITGVDTGVVKLWRDEDCIADINSGSNLHCMTVSSNLICTGGKESDLKIWDVNKHEEVVFQAKNVKNDWLNLRVPVWVTAINFLPEGQIVTATGHHQVRVYDPKVQRRPVLDMTFDKYPITAISLFTENQVIVGNTQGSMALLDIRKGKLIHRFKGFAGSIRSIQCHKSQPYVATCGLDRHFRIHNIHTKQLLHKMYLKSKLNCLLMLDKKLLHDDDGDDDSGFEVGTDVHDEDDPEGSDNDDEVWDKMQVVKTRTVKRKSESVSDVKPSPEKLSKRKTRSSSKKSVVK